MRHSTKSAWFSVSQINFDSHLSTAKVQKEMGASSSQPPKATRLPQGCCVLTTTKKRRRLRIELSAWIGIIIVII